jgi:hypothetical protein
VVLANLRKPLFKSLGSLSRIPPRSYFTDIRFRQFGVPRRFATRPLKHAAPLGNHVGGVVFIGSEKEMCRVYAVANVTPMQNQLASDWAYDARVSDPMSKPSLPSPAGQRHNKTSVPVMGCSGPPKPAIAGLFDFIPKSFLKHQTASLLVSSGVSDFCGSINGSVPH